MTTAVLRIADVPGSIPQRSAPAVSVTLHDIHRQWLDETKDWLSPALAADADFWNGWSAVRYINDQFDRQYRRQLAFVQAILPLLGPTDGFVLRTKTARLERVRRTLDRLGRQQGMSKIVAAACSWFLELLEDWFGELQRVSQGIARADLPAQAQKALGQLKSAVAICAGLSNVELLEKAS